MPEVLTAELGLARLNLNGCERAEGKRSARRRANEEIANGVERAPFGGRQQYPQIDLAISFNDERGHLADHSSLDGPCQVIHREANGG